MDLIEYKINELFLKLEELEIVNRFGHIYLRYGDTNHFESEGEQNNIVYKYINNLEMNGLIELVHKHNGIMYFKITDFGKMKLYEYNKIIDSKYIY